MSKALAIAAANLKRFLRDRSNIFFVFIFPLGLVFILGLSFGGSGAARMGVLAGEEDLSQRLVAALDARPGIEVVREVDEDVLRDRVERGLLTAGLIVPAGAQGAVATGEIVPLQFLAAAGGQGAQLQFQVMAAVGEVSERLRAATFLADRTDSDLAVALARVDELAEGAAEVGVTRQWLGENPFGEEIETFDLGAASQLVLFMFLTGLAASGALIQSRQLGVSRRMLSTPTSTFTVVTGEALGRFAVALFQGVYIMVATWILFGVDWGDMAGALALLTTFAAVAAGAGMLMGAVFRNDQQAGGVAVVVGLGLAALGGAMVPLELFGPTMQSVARLTPHAWAVEGFGVLLRHGGGFTDILPQLAVLVAYAAALLLLASWRLRVALVGR